MFSGHLKIIFVSAKAGHKHTHPMYLCLYTRPESKLPVRSHVMKIIPFFSPHSFGVLGRLPFRENLCFCKNLQIADIDISVPVWNTRCCSSRRYMEGFTNTASMMANSSTVLNFFHVFSWYPWILHTVPVSSNNCTVLLTVAGSTFSCCATSV